MLYVCARARACANTCVGAGGVITNSESLYQHRRRQFTLRIIGGVTHSPLHFNARARVHTYKRTRVRARARTLQPHSFVKLVTVCPSKETAFLFSPLPSPSLYLSIIVLAVIRIIPK